MQYLVVYLFIRDAIRKLRDELIDNIFGVNKKYGKYCKKKKY